MEVDAQFIAHGEDENGGPLYLVPGIWIEWVTTHITEYVRLNTPPPTQTEVMQMQADYNRDNAAERYPQLTHNPRTQTWVDEDQDPVVFTPYGYRKEKEVQNELHG